jgi:hypothetical protein
MIRILLALVIALAPLQAWAASGATTVQANDAGAVARTFNVFSSTGAVTGNLSWMNTVCDFTTVTTCATVDSGHGLTITGEGTAGTATGGVVTVQGVASMTPVLSTVSQATAASLNATVVGTGTLATQVNGFTSWAGSTLGAIANYGTSPGAVLVPGVNAFVTNANTNGQATMANSSPVTLASNQAVADPCTFQAKTNLPINTNSTSSVQLIALSGSTSIYVCSLSLIAAGATTVAFTTGTGTACVTGNAAVIGSTTASIANSMALAANGGLTLGSGVGTIAKGAASSELCIILGSSVFVAGNLTYVQQ